MNNSPLFRMIATITIWLFGAGISITALIQSPSGVGLGTGIVVIACLIASTLATAAVWDQLNDSADSKDKTRLASTEKAKREAGSNTKMALLMELMDDDEHEAFKDMLKQRLMEEALYGEESYNSVSLEELLTDSSSNYARR